MTTIAPHLPDQIEHLPTDTLVPYARNSRTHSPEQVAQIAASIKEFGFTNPVLVDANNTLIAGHGRVMAAQSIGLTTVPAIRLAHLSDAQRRAYVIADNKLAENAGWDMATLAREVEDLNADGYDLELLGFGADELTALLGEYGQDEKAGEGGEGDPAEGGGKGSLSERFMIPPFTVLNAREGWWQDRKRAWLALGIKSELGRGGHDMECDGRQQANKAAPGGSARPAMDYSAGQRGNGAGKAING